MSVVSSERGLSRMQYVKTAQDLLKYTTQKGLKMPKRLTFIITQDLIKTAQDIYKGVLFIKSVYANKTMLNKRMEQCEFCIARLNYLSSQLDLVKVYVPQFTSQVFERWQKLIQDETLLIQGLVKKDKAQ